MGELSAALALLADFTRVFGVIPEMDAESDAPYLPLEATRYCK